MAGGKGQMLEMDKLSLAQLAQLKQQLDQEVDLMGSSLQQLKGAQRKFQESKECLDKLTAECEGKEVLVPLTGSLYVPGNLMNVNKVVIDVGTGYYIEKDNEAGKDYCKRKVKFLTDQMEKIQKIAQQKVIFRDAVIETMEVKLQAPLAAQKLATTPKS